MRDLTARWARAVDGAISDMTDESVYEEFTSVLSYYLEHAQSQADCVHIHKTKTGYRMTDAQGQEMDVAEFDLPDWMRLDMTGADLLLSTLLNLCPQRIVIHNAGQIAPRSLIYSIHRIFKNRVVFES